MPSTPGIVLDFRNIGHAKRAGWHVATWQPHPSCAWSAFRLLRSCGVTQTPASPTSRATTTGRDTPAGSGREFPARWWRAWPPTSTPAPTQQPWSGPGSGSGHERHLDPAHGVDQVPAYPQGPAEAGRPGARRVRPAAPCPGLRREVLLQPAEVSGAYHTRREQGNAGSLSLEVLDAISR